MAERYDEELFLEYVEGELPHDKRVAFENQMLQDPRLRNLVAQMVIDRHRLRTMPDEQPPAHLMDIVHERLERSMLLGDRPAGYAPGSTGSSRTLRWRRLGALAAMAAMFALVASVFLTTLVSLSRETPMSDIGSGTLLPPGIRPSQPLTPTRPPVDPADAGQAATIEPSQPQSQPAVPPSDDPALVQTPPAITPADPADALPVPTADLPADDLPEVDLVLQLTTANVPVARRRLTGWIEAYQAQTLDSRQMPASIAPGAAPTVTPPSPRQADAVTIRLPEAMASHLRTFLGSLSGATLEEWATAPAAAQPAGDDPLKAMESLFPQGHSLIDWLVVPTPGSKAGDPAGQAVKPPLKPQPQQVLSDTGVVEVRVEIIPQR